ncbi:Zn-ribbon domain-containing OB-fold protein [Elioraea rosea]|uniref:Zn-ribbon domain-containing OB-fold protein n=1 Tax=Elioraea rosea TaxID=2492390 RepID=UPI001EF48292|nr:OB-fold domain-containing protein [Elioraea rosea]
MSEQKSGPAAGTAPGPEAVFRAHLAEGKFMLQRSASAGVHVFYPRVAVPSTGETDLEWVEASGLGTVYATTVTRQRPNPDGSSADYNIAIIALDEGPRMMSRVEGIAPDKVTIGMRVKARVATVDGAPNVVFDPA